LTSTISPLASVMIMPFGHASTARRIISSEATLEVMSAVVDVVPNRLGFYEKGIVK